MKIYLIGAVLVLGLFAGLFYGLNKTTTNRCEYYKSLPNYSVDKELVSLCH